MNAARIVGNSASWSGRPDRRVIGPPFRPVKRAVIARGLAPFASASLADRSRPSREECCIDVEQPRISDSQVESVRAQSANARDECASGGDPSCSDVANRAFTDFPFTSARPPSAFTGSPSAFRRSQSRSDHSPVASPALRAPLPLGRWRLPCIRTNGTNGMFDPFALPAPLRACTGSRPARAATPGAPGRVSRPFTLVCRWPARILPTIFRLP